jgi:GDP/UDP-N,N'-diacetylbacillosamine 2-epimerase (hydrolysing)
LKNKKRVIACMTATRADYPRVKSVLQEIENRSNLELKLIVTGMHLLKEFGSTIHEIEKDGFEIAERVEMYSGDDSPYGMAKAAAKCSSGISDALNRIKPDIFLITVDRIETLAAVMSGAFMNLPIAHIQGGEVTGTIDESIRHAVTKMSHIHFPATADAAQRIIKMGETSESVHVVGCPYMDIIRNLDYKSSAELSKKYGFDISKPLVLFTQHPVTTEYGQGEKQVKLTIEALQQFQDIEIVALYSNADAGGRKIIEIMEAGKQFHVFPNIPNEDYLSLMKIAQVMIGNSSAGIREAPSFYLPVVNIGTRQNGRERAKNVIDVPHDIEKITKALNIALFDKMFKEKMKAITNPYGNGYSAKHIVDILETIKLDLNLIQKRIAY